MNPMTGVILCYKDILYYKRLPDLNTIGGAFFIGTFFAIIGFYIFNRLQRRFVEEL